MDGSLTLAGWTRRRQASLLAGAGMLLSGGLAVQQFFAAAYPTTRAASALCDLVPVLGCGTAAGLGSAQLAGAPIGGFGMLLGGLVALGALFPSAAFERTNRALAVASALAVVALLGYATLVLRGFCLPCWLYGGFATLNAALFLRWRDAPGAASFRPAPLHLGVIALAAVGTGLGMAGYHAAVREAEEGVTATRAVSHFYSLPQVPWPSEISPYWTVRSTAEFEDAAVRIVEYADPLCIDCQVIYAQLKQLAAEFPGRLNVAYQFFPLEAKCNDVVEKDKHPGSCDLSYMAAYDPRSFRAIHDEVYDHMQLAKADPAWRVELARRYGVEAALTDTALQARVHRLIATGAEYEQTSAQHAHGIRSTPTLIINNRMIIGTLPLGQLRAIVRALIEEHEGGHEGFIENWIDPGCSLDPEGGPPLPCS